MKGIVNIWSIISTTVIITWAGYTYLYKGKSDIGELQKQQKQTTELIRDEVIPLLKHVHNSDSGNS